MQTHTYENLHTLL